MNSLIYLRGKKMFRGYKTGIKKCPQCGRVLEQLQKDQWACKEERILFVCYDIGQEEMIEWFVE